MVSRCGRLGSSTGNDRGGGSSGPAVEQSGRWKPVAAPRPIATTNSPTKKQRQRDQPDRHRGRGRGPGAGGALGRGRSTEGMATGLARGRRQRSGDRPGRRRDDPSGPLAHHRLGHARPATGAGVGRVTGGLSRGAAAQARPRQRQAGRSAASPPPISTAPAGRARCRRHRWPGRWLGSPWPPRAAWSTRSCRPGSAGRPGSRRAGCRPGPGPSRSGSRTAACTVTVPNGAGRDRRRLEVVVAGGAQADLVAGRDGARVGLHEDGRGLRGRRASERTGRVGPERAPPGRRGRTCAWNPPPAVRGHEGHERRVWVIFAPPTPIPRRSRRRETSGSRPDGPARPALRYRDCCSDQLEHGRLGALRLSISSTVLVFVVIPVAVIALVASLVVSRAATAPGAPAATVPAGRTTSSRSGSWPRPSGSARRPRPPAVATRPGDRRRRSSRTAPAPAVLPGPTGGASDSW